MPVKDHIYSFRQMAVLGLGILALAWALFSLQRKWELLEPFEQDSPTSSNFGGTNWVQWIDSPEGVKAQSIHPIVKNNPLLQDRYFIEGDILKRIEYQDVYRAEMVENLAYHTSPGTVLLYWVDRQAPSQEGGGWTSLFIENSFRPRFTFVENHTLWTLNPWLLALGDFLSLISMLIILPIFRRAPKETWRIFMVITFSFLTFLGFSLHHLNLLVSNSYENVQTEQFFTFSIAVLLPLYGLATLASRLREKLWWLFPLPLAAFGYAALAIRQTMNGGEFHLFASSVESFVMLFYLVLVLTMLMLSIFQMWSGRSQLDKVFHILAILYVCPLLLIYGLSLTNYGSDWRGEFSDMLVYASIFIPLINSAAAQLKFGRVSLVLTGTLQFVVFSVFIMIAYFLIDFALEYIGIQVKYQAYLELCLMIIIVILLRSIYKWQEPNVKRYFVLAQQNRRDRIDRFISSISQYSSSLKLLEDLHLSLKNYFETDAVGIRIKGEPIVGEVIDLKDDEIEYIYQDLRKSNQYWVRHRQIVKQPVAPETEVQLKQLPYSLAIPITINERIYGLILLGRKRRGVFNLEDQELLQRIVQQTRLTLGVLHLLEREKLLMQKNYEANLTALRSQINPHFLFNTLNTISALIHDDPDDAEVAVEKLAFIFRYTLKNSDKATVMLKDELSLVRTYLEIEKIRFGDRLNLNYEIDDSLLEVELPAFVVQTVIENCIKHGIAKIIGKGFVSIKVVDEGELVRCEIEDNGPGIDLTRIHASTGLSNTHERMSQIYGRDDLLHFENTGKGTLVKVWLPKSGPLPQ